MNDLKQELMNEKVYNRKLWTRVSQPIYTEIEAIAKETDSTISAIVRAMLKLQIKRYRNTQK